MMNQYCDRAKVCFNKGEWLGPLLARITLGVVFAQAGWGKLNNLTQVTGFFTELGIPAAHIQAPFVAGLEFVGGLMVLLGLCTRFISIPLAFTMVVAIATAKRAEVSGVTDLLGLSEFAYLVMFVWLVVAGAGKISVDGWCEKRCQKN